MKKEKQINIKFSSSFPGNLIPWYIRICKVIIRTVSDLENFFFFKIIRNNFLDVRPVKCSGMIF